MKRTVYRTCTWCEACCGIEVEVDGDQVTGIRGDPLDPLSQGYICPKAYALKDLHEDPDRLRYPIRRTSTGWERIGWDEALDYAAEGLLEIQRRHGLDAVATYLGNPTAHNVGAVVFMQELRRALGSRNCYSASTLDQFPKMVAAHFLYGNGVLFSIPDVDRTDFMLILGANPLVSNGSIMTAPDMRRRLRRIQERGGRVVVVDPRRSETARVADQHLFIRPGTDAFLAAALVHTLFDEDLVRLGKAEAFTEGLEDLRGAVADFGPEAVAEKTGIAAAEIRALARAFAAAPSACAYGRIGTCVNEFGTTANWFIEAFNILTGNLDRPGGMMFPNGMADVTMLYKTTPYGRWRSRVRGTPEFLGELPAGALAEEIETPGEGQVRGLLTLAGNPVLSSPAGHRLSGAFERLDFMVSVDFYLNETTRHAHVILPPTGPLEHDHIDLVFAATAVRLTAKWSPKVFDAPADTRDDADIHLALIHRLFAGRGPGGRAQALAYKTLARMGGQRAWEMGADAGVRMGAFGDRYRPWRGGLTLKKIKRSEHGIDLGPIQPCLPERLGGDRRVRLAHPDLIADLPRLRAALGKPTPELMLIGRRELRTNNSWAHNLPSLVSGPRRCVLFMHPVDATARDVETDDSVVVASRVGSVEVPVHVTDEVMPGVVSLPHGYGHAVEGVRMKVAKEHAGVSVNDLTDPEPMDPLSGTAVLNGVPVTVRAVHAEAVA